MRKALALLLAAIMILSIINIFALASDEAEGELPADVSPAAEELTSAIPTDAAETPAIPMDAAETPAIPTETPTEPTETPAIPTETPAEPTEAPTEPTETPTEPTEEELTEPTDAPQTGENLPEDATPQLVTYVLMCAGETQQLHVVIDPEKPITWASTDETVCTVSETGLVTAIAVGNAIVTADDGDQKPLTFMITVNDGQVTKVRVAPTEKTLGMREGVGDTVQLSAGVEPSNALNKNVEWKSNNETIATVDAFGSVTAVAEGTATITATSVNGISAEAKITVKNRYHITLGDNLVSVPEGITEVFSGDSFSFVPKIGGMYFVSVLTKDGEKFADAERDEETGIFTVRNITQDIEIKATNELKLIVEPEEFWLAMKESKTLSVTTTLGLPPEKVLWTSSDAGIAEVDDAGKITPVARGDVEITATALEDDGVTPDETVVPGKATLHVRDKLSIVFEQSGSFQEVDGRKEIYEGQTLSFKPIKESDDTDLYTYTWHMNGTAVDYELKDGVFTLKTPVTGNGDGKVVIRLDGSAPKSFDAKVTSESTAEATIVLAENKPVYKTDYIFYVQHEEDKRDYEVPQDAESEYIYTLPSVTIDGVDFYDYSLTAVQEPESEYSKRWKFTIPGDEVCGDIVVNIEKYLRPLEGESDGFRKLVWGENIEPSDGSRKGFVPYDSFLGDDIFNWMPITDTSGTDFFFYYIKDTTQIMNFECGEGEGRLNIEQMGTNVYRIIDVAPYDEPAVLNAKVASEVTVTKEGSGKHEEVLIELKSTTTYVKRDYSFAVKPHELVIPFDLDISVKIGDLTFSTSNPGDYMTWTQRNEDYVDFTIKGQYITDDITIGANCKSDASRIRSALLFTKSANYIYSITRPAFDIYESDYVQASPKKNTSDPTDTIYRFEVPPYTPGKNTGFNFEVIATSPNSYGKYYTDPNTSCYSYTFEGSTMGGKLLNPATDIAYYDTKEADGTFHRRFYFTFPEITGDMEIKTALNLKTYNVRAIGGATVTAENGSALPTTAKYRANFKFKTNATSSKLKIYVNNNKLSSSAYTLSGGLCTLAGGYIRGDVLIKALKANEYEVTVAGTKKEAVTITNDGICGGGNDYKFTVGSGTDIAITSNSRVLQQGTDYSVSGGTYTIYSSKINGDIYISATKTSTTPTYYGGGGSGYSYSTPSYTYNTTSNTGSAYDFEVVPYMRLKDGRSVYLIIAHGEPAEGYSPTFDGHKMAYSESYDAYTWMAVDETDDDAFIEGAGDFFEELTPDELEERRIERQNNGEEEIEFTINESEVIGDLNGDGVFDIKDAEFVRELYETDEIDFTEIPMDKYLLADVDGSFTLDMQDVEVMKFVVTNMDKLNDMPEDGEVIE